MLRYHGDQAVEPGMLDFAVNVRQAAPPRWLQKRLSARIKDLAAYPTELDTQRAREAVAERHGRSSDEVLLLAGAAEGFALIAHLGFRHAALPVPSFTEPEHVLRQAGVRITHIHADLQAVPGDADLLVVGNPTNPTSILHPKASILAARASGRMIVVDEAFADADPAEPESLAGAPHDGLVVIRSLTKTWALAGLRCGYALGPADVVQRLAVTRPHWPLGTLQLEAIYQCSRPEAIASAAREANRMRADRDYFIAELQRLGLTVTEPASGPFVLVRVTGADRVRNALARRRIAVRRCDTFPGLDPDHLRFAVRIRPDIDRLIAALGELL